MIGITTGIMLFMSVANPLGMSAHFPLATSTEVVQVAEVQSTPLTIETYVRNYFADSPILAEVARCESTFRQFDSKGNPIRGLENASDVGVMQINEYYHAERAKKLGLDLYTLEGNMEYAKLLYKTQGTAPWSASKPCWGSHSAEVAMK